MAKRASRLKGSSRCAELTAIETLVSPISSRQKAIAPMETMNGEFP